MSAELLDDVERFLGRFVAYPSAHARVAHTLWIAHTWFMDKWDSTPRIAFLSPEKGSGKSRCLEVTETLVPRGVQAINTTPAYLFRKVSDPQGLPTILYDEIDTVFGPKAKDNEEVRGMLNAGHRQGAVAGRCVVKGKIVETEELPAYCAVALAGLNDLPDTIMSRSVIVRMRRRGPGESVEPWRRRLNEPQGLPIAARLAQWAQGESDRMAWPDMPDGIEDRNADVWESLLAVADLAGGEWPTRARVAAVALVADSRGDRQSLGVTLLRDLQTIFEGHDKMHTEDILKALHEMPEAPWGSLKGEPINPRFLSDKLRDYGVHSKDVRIGAVNRKGYTAADLYDPWSRYVAVTESSIGKLREEEEEPAEDQIPEVSVPPQEGATSATSATRNYRNPACPAAGEWTKCPRSNCAAFKACTGPTTSEAAA